MYALLKIFKLFDNITCIDLRYVINFLIFKIHKNLIKFL